MTGPSKSPQRIAGMFDAIAARYDFLNHFLSAGIDRRWRAQAIRSLGLCGNERVLDLCTGTGDLAIAAVEAAPEVHVVGVDFAGAMLRIGLDKVRGRGLANRIALVRGDATRIPLADGTANAVTIGFGIRNVEDMPAACREMHRVLAADGRLAILEFGVPDVPIVGAIYGLYLNRVLPLLGRAISRNNVAYGYLPESIGAFSTPAEFVTILRNAGFVDIEAVRLTFGAVLLYKARRP